MEHGNYDFVSSTGFRVVLAPRNPKEMTIAAAETAENLRSPSNENT